MPTILSHTAVPLALGIGLGSRLIPGRLLLAGVAASILPDFDVLAFRLHIAYSHILGHRGLSHSVSFALALACLAWLLAPQLRSTRTVAFAFIGLATISHPLLDMLTDGGLGVALWWPWSSERLFAPWRVIEVSPLDMNRLFGTRGLAVLRSELLWVWLPAMLTCIALFAWRSWHSQPQRQNTAP